MAGDGEYCAFTKALEHLGDRWSLLIVRDLMIFGSLGFNALASGLPGISRSVLAARLRHLSDLGVVARASRSDDGVGKGYRLSASGQQLVPVVMALRTWAERWVPEDKAMLDRDPDVVVAWLAQRIDPARLPDRQVVIDLALSGAAVGRCWLVLERGTPPSICIEDPMLSADRYVFLEGDIRALAPVASGAKDLRTETSYGDIRLFGDPGLVAALPGWFRDSDERGHRPAVIVVTA